MKFIPLILLSFLLILSGCTEKLENNRSWVYQLQGASPTEIASSGFDIVVMDYSYDGSDEMMYSKEDISKIKESGKTALAYVSIGEAEDYRYYWKEEWYEDPPEWLGEENPEWEGNYAVRYWMDGWKDIVFNYLDRVKSQGFDGVYLDKIDEFEYWADKGVAPEEVLASSMVEFISDIRERLEGMLVFIQNGERIVELDPDVLKYVDGIGIEDLWYMETEKLSEEETNERLKYIREFKKFGKTVLVVDYVDDGSGYSGENLSRIKDFISKARSEGFIPYAARSDRELDEIVVIEGIQPPSR